MPHYITSQNFTAHVEALAHYQPLGWPHHAIYALGIAGAQSSIKAIWANLLQGSTALVSYGMTGSGHYMRLHTSDPRDWKVWLAHIPAAGVSHLVLLPRCAFYHDSRPNFLLLPKSEEQAPALFWRFLNERTDFPIHRSWADKLWAASMSQRTRLNVIGSIKSAFYCEPRYPDIQAYITKHVQLGRLTVQEAAYA